MRKKKWERCLVDGYNVIHFWPEYKGLLNQLEEARHRLIHALAEYGAYEKVNLTLVFDAMFTDDEEHEERVNEHMTVLFTGAGETADSCIERLAYAYAKQGEEVHVVTSDGAEQSVILGAGAYRIPSTELRRRVLRAKKAVRKEYLGPVTLPNVRLDVQDRLDAETAAKLDALRKQKD